LTGIAIISGVMGRPNSGCPRRKMPKARIVHPVNDGKAPAAAGPARCRLRAARQRTGGHFAQEIAARAGEIDAAELQNIVAPGVVQLPGTKHVVLLVAMFGATSRVFFSASDPPV